MSEGVEAEEALNSSFLLTLSGQGLEFAKNIDASQVPKIMALALGHSEMSGHQAHATRGQDQPDRAERLSLREFVDSSAAKKIPEKILAMGAYVEEHEGREGFTRDDIKNRFRQAGEAQPGNFPRDFGVAISSGWIAEDHNVKGSFYVTKTGRSAIDAAFSSDVARIQRRTSRRRKPGRQSEIEG